MNELGPLLMMLMNHGGVSGGASPMLTPGGGISPIIGAMKANPIAPVMGGGAKQMYEMNPLLQMIGKNPLFHLGGVL